ncbi:MAG: isochorismatase family cysteine hydrolase [Armatimonadota bacterium]|nr:isochorismatase family cysteine hydrolase [Armatimonadota bacterium]MDR7427299.1 isochorismatase family cysteine hydrolase [Armatimonadota bacterium]MDR7469921.1 isochorismatase family cysteine hydrolase [Armatimonadota bacterium]MDR7474606.1 isochorismatase family cysteine hydrolase [Armatimonadota bacterium]MDR7539849.1 isochorismatase family cysteine hydrolase [Armatimonadota bacterium]
MTVTVEAPEYTLQPEVVVEPRQTALVVVDMQNDFVKPGGALVVPTAAATIPAVQRLLALARAAGMRVFFTQDTHQEGDIEFPIWGPHVLRGTWGWQIVDELAPQPGERVLEKLRYDGFFGTPLDHELRLAGVQSVIICGTVANICVLHTAGSAALRGYRVILPVDAISAITPFDLQVAIRQVSFLYRGVITTSEAIRAG